MSCQARNLHFEYNIADLRPCHQVLHQISLLEKGPRWLILTNLTAPLLACMTMRANSTWNVNNHIISSGYKSKVAQGNDGSRLPALSRKPASQCFWLSHENDYLSYMKIKDYIRYFPGVVSPEPQLWGSANAWFSINYYNQAIAMKHFFEIIIMFITIFGFQNSNGHEHAGRESHG